MPIIQGSGQSGQAETLSPTKRALVAIRELQAKLDTVEWAQHEPIAIVGMGCRVPGGVNAPEQFWQLLQQQVNAITEIPGDRWDVDAYYSPDPTAPGKICSRHGGFVPHPYDFDAQFFRIAPREALTLDPQQRLLLEVGWETLEHAGLAPDALIGTQTGVFVGICSIDYWHLLLARQSVEIDAYLTTGNTHSVAAGRLSYLLGLAGPSLAIDTACSSSLVAVHLACQSLRQRECATALAGGVNRILSPAASINFSKAKMLSPDGCCRSFAADANGFVRSEGCGMVALKRLSDAERDGDTVWAIILGSATNHDGRTSGLTVPHGPAQQAVIRQALQNSRIAPSRVSYIETHGTGTALGDPIEVGALEAVFGPGRSPAQALILGAVKSNIGHLEAAAGITGLIKAVLALHHQEIPANLHAKPLNPLINWSDLPFKVPTQAVPWAATTQPRIAGVSAFGFNGTNAHVIVGEWMRESMSETMAAEEQPSQNGSEHAHLLVLSARTEAALREMVRRYAAFFAEHPDLVLDDICFTASVGRSHANYRLTAIASSLADMREKLLEFEAGQAHPDVQQTRVQPSDTTGHSAPTVNVTQNVSQSDRTNRDLMLRLTAQRYLNGEPIDWDILYPPGMHRKVVLPTYPFQRQRYAIETS